MRNTKNIFTSMLALIIYWSIVYFLIKKTFGNEFTLEHIIGSMGFISSLALIAAIVLLVIKITGTILFGTIGGLIACLALCDIGNRFVTSHNISDQTLEYLFFGIGVAFNAIMLLRIINGIRKINDYSIMEVNQDYDLYSEPIDITHNLDVDFSIEEELKKQELLLKINNNLKQIQEKRKHEN